MERTAVYFTAATPQFTELKQVRMSAQSVSDRDLVTDLGETDAVFSVQTKQTHRSSVLQLITSQSCSLVHCSSDDWSQGGSQCDCSIHIVSSVVKVRTLHHRCLVLFQDELYQRVGTNHQRARYVLSSVFISNTAGWISLLDLNKSGFQKAARWSGRGLSILSRKRESDFLVFLFSDPGCYLTPRTSRLSLWSSSSNSAESDY